MHAKANCYIVLCSQHCGQNFICCVCMEDGAVCVHNLPPFTVGYFSCGFSERMIYVPVIKQIIVHKVPSCTSALFVQFFRPLGRKNLANNVVSRAIYVKVNDKGLYWQVG